MGFGSGQHALQHLAVGGILIIISFLIFLALLTPLNTSIANYKTASPTPDATSTSLVTLIPTILVAGSLIIGVVFLVSGFKGLSTK